MVNVMPTKGEETGRTIPTWVIYCCELIKGQSSHFSVFLKVKGALTPPQGPVSLRGTHDASGEQSPGTQVQIA